MQRAVSTKSKPSKQARDQLQDALSVARDHGLDVPAGIQALATNIAPASVKSSGVDADGAEAATSGQ